MKFYLQWHQNIRYLRINLVKDIHENYEALLGKTKGDLN